MVKKLKKIYKLIKLKSDQLNLRLRFNLNKWFKITFKSI